MRRGTDVQLMMTRVATALARTSRSPGNPVIVLREGDDGLGIARLRDLANIRTDFHSGSDRFLVGPAIRLTKRAVRRSLRWYLTPMAEQQSEFNHAVLDLVETLRLRNERLAAELEAWRSGAGGRLPSPDREGDVGE